VTVKLYAGEKLTPKERRGDLKDAKRAKRFADKPLGKEELGNGVIQYFFLRENAAAEWELVVERVREEAAE
jgi:hypothetical protein